MSTLFANSIRLNLVVILLAISGCSLFTPKPEVVDRQEAVLGPIEPELQKSFAEALVLLRDEEFAEAELLLLGITEKFPNYAGPWSNLAIAQSKQEKFQSALDSLEKALNQDEKFCPAIAHKGVVLRELGQFKQAKEQYIAALICNPEDAMAIYNLGVLSDLYLHDAASALSYYQHYLLTQKPEQQDETVKNWVVDLKRRVPVEEQITVSIPKPLAIPSPSSPSTAEEVADGQEEVIASKSAEIGSAKTENSVGTEETIDPAATKEMDNVQSPSQPQLAGEEL